MIYHRIVPRKVVVAVLLSLLSSVGVALAQDGRPPETLQVEEGRVSGPILKGQSRVVARIQDKEVTVTVKSNCPTADRPLGQWKSNFGTMDFGDGKQGVKATYDHFNGALSGSLDSAIPSSEGIWTQSDANRACSTEQNGSKYWGEYRFEFSRKFDLFSGSWNYCGEESSAGRWNGFRNCPANLLEPVRATFRDEMTLFETVDEPDIREFESGTFDFIRGVSNRDKVIYWVENKTKWTCDKNGLEVALDAKQMPIMNSRERKNKEYKPDGVSWPSLVAFSVFDRRGENRFVVFIDQFSYRNKSLEAKINPVSLVYGAGKAIITAGESIAFDLAAFGAKQFGAYMKSGLIQAASHPISEAAHAVHGFEVECIKTPNGRFKIIRSSLRQVPHEFRDGKTPPIYFSLWHQRSDLPNFPLYGITK